jgi:hypothetical protein
LLAPALRQEALYTDLADRSVEDKADEPIAYQYHINIFLSIPSRDNNFEMQRSGTCISQAEQNRRTRGHLRLAEIKSFAPPGIALKNEGFREGTPKMAGRARSVSGSAAQGYTRPTLAESPGDDQNDCSKLLYDWQRLISGSLRIL